MSTITAIVWVCDNCGDYYGASSAGDLDEKWNEHKGEQTFKRSRCPTPSCAKQDIHRRPVAVEIPLAPVKIPGPTTTTALS